jgi:hypothetical protein
MSTKYILRTVFRIHSHGKEGKLAVLIDCAFLGGALEEFEPLGRLLKSIFS